MMIVTEPAFIFMKRRNRMIRALYLQSGPNAPIPVPALLRVIVLSLLFSLLPRQVHATADDFPMPGWLDTVTVGEQMIINGLPSSVRYFEAPRDIDDLLDFYRRQWRHAGGKSSPGYREAEVLPWHIISRLDGRYLYTVQVQESGPFTISGYLAVTDLKTASRKNHEINAPKMSGSRLLNRSTSVDPGKTGHTLMIANAYSLTGNLQYYRDYYRERGWIKLVDMEVDESRVLAFRKRNRESHLVLQHIGEATQIVMNLVEHN